MPHYILFGNPIAHSISPQLHKLFAKQFNASIDYQKKLTPLDKFKETVDAFRAQGGLGANITIPFKISAFQYADQLTDRATLAGAVNTFIFKDEICIGDNTDGIGFIRDIKNHLNIHNKNILIIGAGGATRGILSDIIREKPSKIIIHNRSPENTQLIIDYFKSYFEIKPFETKTHFDLIINATTIDFQTDFPLKLNLENTFCYDLNYGERADSFLNWAKLNGAKNICDGFGMLVEQGAESFYQWFGKMPETKNAILFRRDIDSSRLKVLKTR